MSDGPESGLSQLAHRAPTAAEAARRGRAMRSLVLSVVVLVVAGVIVYREVPWIQRQIQQLVNPAQARAVEACEVAALKLARTPEFARIIKPGRVHPTAGGFYVEHMVLGQMAQQGGEERSFMDCHADRDGNVVNIGVPGRRGTVPPDKR